MRPLEKLKALLESKGIYRQAIRLMREHKRLKEEEEMTGVNDDNVEKKEDKKPRRRRKMPDGEKDQMDYPWNEPGAPFRDANY